MIEDPGYWENMALAAALFLGLWAGVLKWQDYVKPPTHVDAPEAFAGIGGGGAAGYGPVAGKPEVICMGRGACRPTDKNVLGIGEHFAPNK